MSTVIVTSIDEALEMLNTDINTLRVQKTSNTYVQLAKRILRSANLSDEDMLELAARGLASQAHPVAPEDRQEELPTYEPPSDSPAENRPTFAPRKDFSIVRPPKLTPAILSVLDKIRNPFGTPMALRDMGEHELSKLIEISTAQIGGHAKLVEGFKYAKSRLRATGKRFIRELSEAERVRIAERIKNGEVAFTEK